MRKAWREPMTDEMFFSSDMRSLRRGKRAAARTETCRPCLVWETAQPGNRLQGVVMDINPYGVRVRMFETLPPNTEVIVQLMRDEDFQVPLATAVEGTVVRLESAAGNLTDHGIRLVKQEIEHRESKPIRIERRPARRTRKARMHAFDVTVGERHKRRSGR